MERLRFIVFIARPPPEINRGFTPAHWLAGPWQSGLMHPIYNRGERVHARSGGPNPSGPANMLTYG